MDQRGADVAYCNGSSALAGCSGSGSLASGGADDGRLISRCGLDVLFTLCSQHQPRVSHNEQFALGFNVIEGLSKLEAFLGV